MEHGVLVLTFSRPGLGLYKGIWRSQLARHSHNDVNLEVVSVQKVCLNRGAVHKLRNVGEGGGVEQLELDVTLGLYFRGGGGGQAIDISAGCNMVLLIVLSCTTSYSLLQPTSMYVCGAVFTARCTIVQSAVLQSHATFFAAARHFFPPHL